MAELGKNGVEEKYWFEQRKILRSGWLQPGSFSNKPICTNFPSIYFFFCRICFTFEKNLNLSCHLLNIALSKKYSQKRCVMFSHSKRLRIWPATASRAPTIPIIKAIKNTVCYVDKILQTRCTFSYFSFLTLWRLRIWPATVIVAQGSVDFYHKGNWEL